jgi:molybdopterin molybdotransferase
MLRVEEALAIVADALGPPRARLESVPLDAALGRFLATSVRMDHDVPPFRRATMDGFAVRAAEAAAGVVLPVAGRIAAGEASGGELRAGTAVRITTGAPVPEGADAVVPFEATEASDEAVRFRDGARSGANIVARGEHRREGDEVLAPGTRIGPAAIGVLATAGRATVEVAARPVVAVLATGTELVPVTERPGPTQIRNSNSAVLRAQAARAGGAPIDLGVARDDASALREAIRRGLSADLLVLSGGVSMGDFDLVPASLEAEGVRRRFHRWAVQPGGPLWFGTRGDTLVFGLPGNPAASFVGFEVLAVPAIRTRLGLPFAPRAAVRARYAGPWSGPSDRRRYRPVRLEVSTDARSEARATGWRGSGDPFGLASGDGIVAIPEGFAPPPSGEALLEVIRLGDEP